MPLQASERSTAAHENVAITGRCSRRRSRSSTSGVRSAYHLSQAQLRGKPCLPLVHNVYSAFRTYLSTRQHSELLKDESPTRSAPILSSRSYDNIRETRWVKSSGGRSNFTYSRRHFRRKRKRASHSLSRHRAIPMRHQDAECSNLVFDATSGLCLSCPNEAQSCDVARVSCSSLCLPAPKYLWRYVTSSCSVKQYDLSALSRALTVAGVVTSFKDTERCILYFDLLEFACSTLGGARLSDDCNALAFQHTLPVVHTFVFQKGQLVVWGAEVAVGQDQKKQPVCALAPVAYDSLVTFLKSFSDSPWPSSWVGYSSQRYCLASDLPPEACVPSTRVKHDRLYLKSGCVEELVAASLALGESCRLHVYEQAVDNAILKFNKLPLRLAAHEFDEHIAYGSSQLMKIRQWVGEIYTISVEANIVEDFLDVPQYFWDQNTFQPFWKRLHDYLELENRMEVLNLRIRCLKEVLKVVCRRKVSAQGIYLMWCVIILLAAGVVVTVVKEYLDRAR